MVLTKENKAALFEIIGEGDESDLSYVKMLIEVRQKELIASRPRGMNYNEPPPQPKGFFGR